MSRHVRWPPDMEPPARSESLSAGRAGWSGGLAGKAANARPWAQGPGEPKSRRAFPSAATPVTFVSSAQRPVPVPAALSNAGPARLGGPSGLCRGQLGKRSSRPLPPQAEHRRTGSRPSNASASTSPGRRRPIAFCTGSPHPVVQAQANNPAYNGDRPSQYPSPSTHSDIASVRRRSQSYRCGGPFKAPADGAQPS